MSKNIVLKKGLNIPIAGEAELRVSKAIAPGIVAVCPTDIKGLLPRLLVKEGDKKPIIMNITDGNMELRINSFIGSMNEDIDIDKDGKDIMIGFNPKFFIDALRVIDEEEVNLYMVNPKAPCFIKDDDGKFIYLILPVNFNTAAN